MASPPSALLRHLIGKFHDLRKLPPLRVLVHLYRSVQCLISVLRKSSDKRCPTLPTSSSQTVPHVPQFAVGRSSQTVPQFAVGLCSPPTVAPFELAGSSSQHSSRPDVNDDVVSLPEIDLSDRTLVLAGLVASPSQDILEQDQPEIALQASEAQAGSDWLLYPFMPEDLPRRELFKPTLKFNELASYTVQPGQTSFKTKDRLPDGWDRHTNSEGHPFFHHEEKNILTDVWLYDDLVQEFILPLADDLRSRAQEYFPDVTRRCQLVVSIKQFKAEEGDDGRRCGYYFADHQQRNLLWLEAFEIGGYLHGIRGGQIQPEHAKLLIDCQYWMHFEYFDDVQHPSPEDWATFLKLVTVAHADMLTSTSSTCNQPLASLETMRQISESLRTPEADHCASAWVLGRFMERLANDRFHNFFGQNGARLNSFDSIYGEVSKHSLMFDFFSPVLFSAPDVHLKTLENMWVDQVTRREAWKDLVAKLTAEWEQHKVFGTILLTTNAAFLAIPSVDVNDPGHRVVQLLSYLSIVAGLGCIMLGALLHRQHKTRSYSVTEAHKFLTDQDGKHGLEALAVMYSLPYALSMWGTNFFLAAFLVMCCISQSLITTTTVIGSWIIVTFLISWCVKMAWQPGRWSRLAMSTCQQIRSSLADRPSPLAHLWVNNDSKRRTCRFYLKSIRDSIPSMWRGRDLEAQD